MANSARCPSTLRWLPTWYYYASRERRRCAAPRAACRVPAAQRCACYLRYYYAQEAPALPVQRAQHCARRNWLLRMQLYIAISTSSCLLLLSLLCLLPQPVAHMLYIYAFYLLGLPVSSSPGDLHSHLRWSVRLLHVLIISAYSLWQEDCLWEAEGAALFLLELFSSLAPACRGIFLPFYVICTIACIYISALYMKTFAICVSILVTSYKVLWHLHQWHAYLQIGGGRQQRRTGRSLFSPGGVLLSHRKKNSVLL